MIRKLGKGAFLSAGLLAALLCIPFAQADVISGPQLIVFGGLGLLIIVGIPVVIIALVSYFILRHIKKKHKAEEAAKVPAAKESKESESKQDVTK
jgi:preprotein translocase subunit SecY